jgi:ATP-binding cassette, subfamily C, bacterial CydCD
MKLITRLLSLSKYTQIGIALSIGLGFVGGILSVFQAGAISHVINQVFLASAGMKAVTGSLFFILVIFLIRAVCVWGAEITATNGAHNIKEDLRNRMYTHILEVGPAYLRNATEDPDVHTGELINAASEGLESLEVYISHYLPQIALAILIPLAILAFVFQTDPLSGILLLVTAPLMPVFMYLIGSAAEALTRKQWRGLGRMSAYFLDLLQGLTALKSMGRSQDQIEGVSRVSERYRQATMRVLKVTFLSAMVLELVATLSTAIVAVEVGIRLLYGKIAFEQAFFILILAPEFYLPLRILGARFHAGMAGREAADRIFEILDIPANFAQPGPNPTLEPVKISQVPPAIQFKDIQYTYSGDRAALHDISFEIPSSKTTAIIGESSAGKTTLTWLLLGFLQPQQGEITVDGIPLNQIPITEWRDKLAWVSQNPYLFNTTVADNIKVAKPGANMDAVRLAAKLAYADEFIQQLPLGYDSLIGEHAIRLSAGQAQRIALARAFLKDAPLLILDEATSHLDPETDAMLQESLIKLTHGRTVLMIAHHLNTVARADNVIRLEQSTIDRSYEFAPHRVSTLDSLQATVVPEKHLHLSATVDHSSVPPEKKETESLSKQPVERRLLKLLSPFAPRIFLSVLLGFATIASGIGLMATAAYIISFAALHPSIADLQIAIVGVRFFGLSRGIFRYLERLASHDTTLRLLARWRVWFYQALEPLAPARLMSYHSGDLLSRVISDITSLENFYVRSIAPPLVAILVSITSLILLGGFGTPLAWGLLLFLILAGLGLPLLVLQASNRFGAQIVTGYADLKVKMVDGIQGMADLLTCDQAESQMEKVKKASKKLTSLQTRVSLISAIQSAAGNFLSNLAMLAVLVLGIQLVTYDLMDGVFLGLITLIALSTFEAMLPLPQAAQYYAINHTAAQRLYELVDEQPSVVDPPTSLKLSTDYNLEVNNLSFRYPYWKDETISKNNQAFCLEDISFTLPYGKHIAILGSSGAGKTTLLNLLQRFWEYDVGSIRLGGNELKSYLQNDIRKHITVLSQNTYLFNASLKDNLCLARPNASTDELDCVIRAACLDQLLDTLPNRYDTWIGEHGFRLSAGERQRLAIARLFLTDAPIVLLDEPTVYLDPDTEKAVMSSIRTFCAGRSSITITQHLVGIEDMNEILVIQNGRIVEQGEHYELLARAGLYYRMWKIYNQTV